MSTQDWMALRCNTGKTAALASGLSAAGTQAWTPVQMISRRKPRCTVRQSVPVPLLPTFVFLPLEQLGAASDLLLRCRVPPFSPMRFMGKLATFAEDQLQPLRLVSAREGAEPPRLRFPRPGTRVRLSFGGFEGLTAVVVGRTKHESLVELERGGMALKIPPFLFTVAER